MNMYGKNGSMIPTCGASARIWRNCVLFIAIRQTTCLPTPLIRKGWATRRTCSLLVNSRKEHRNPVRRGLVETPEQWAWSSFRGVCVWGEGTGTRERAGVGGEDQAEETGEIWGNVGRILTPLNRKGRD